MGSSNSSPTPNPAQMVLDGRPLRSAWLQDFLDSGAPGSPNLGDSKYPK